MPAEALVLCGGEGTRMRRLIERRGYPSTFPKSLLPLGPRGKPLLDYVLRLILRHGIHEITIVTRAGSNAIQDYFGDGSKLGATLHYYVQTSQTGNGEVASDAISGNAVFGRERTLIYYGDILSNLDISKLTRSQLRSGADVTLVLADDYRLPVNVVKTGANGLVEAMVVRPTLTQAVGRGKDVHPTLGAMMLSRRAVKELASSSKAGLDLIRDFVPALIEKGWNVSAYIHDGFWRDTGTEDAYLSLRPTELKRALGNPDHCPPDR